MKSKFIIECETKEEKNCVEDAIANYKDYLEEQIYKNISVRKEKYYRERMELTDKILEEFK